jgi:hypothetical protein
LLGNGIDAEGLVEEDEDVEVATEDEIDDEVSTEELVTGVETMLEDEFLYSIGHPDDLGDA